MQIKYVYRTWNLFLGFITVIWDFTPNYLYTCIYTGFDYRETCPNTGLPSFSSCLNQVHISFLNILLKNDEIWYTRGNFSYLLTSWISLSKLSILSLFRLISESLVISSNLKLEPSLSSWWVEVWYCSASTDKALYCSSKSDLSDSCQIENKKNYNQNKNVDI